MKNNLERLANEFCIAVRENMDYEQKLTDNVLDLERDLEKAILLNKSYELRIEQLKETVKALVEENRALKGLHSNNNERVSEGLSFESETVYTTEEEENLRQAYLEAGYIEE